MKDALIKFLTSLGLQNELELYLRLFKQVQPHKFAVVKISGATLSEKMDTVAEDLAFLSKLGLCPIVIHGGGKPIDEALNKKGLEIKKVNGMRITNKEVMLVTSKVLNKLTNQLVSLINKKGGHALNINDFGMIKLKKSGSVGGVDLGLVAEITDININKFKELCDFGYMPVLASMGNIDGTSFNVNADILANAIVKKTRPKKFILLTDTGGILDKQGQIISVIDVQYDLEQLVNGKIISDGMLLKVREIKKLLQFVPDTVVEICSPENLLKELFTVKGSGTFVRYGGNFLVKNNFKELNTKKIQKLLVDSFCKVLSDDYFDQPIDLVIADKDYSAVAIIKKISGQPYLDKFAVSKNAQGNGLGKTVWSIVKKHYPSLIWRSSLDNPINSWYFKNADGVHKSDKWAIFWYNLQPSTVLIQTISNIVPTLVKKCDVFFLNQNNNFDMVKKC
ncbi:MAG: acetylglutamate kinase [Candidatus Micrarchaeota archaeon]